MSAAFVFSLSLDLIVHRTVQFGSGRRQGLLVGSHVFENYFDGIFF